MSRFSIRPTTYAEVTAKALHLLTEHWEEVALNKGIMVLKPDEGRYLHLEATGNFFALAAFDGDDLVGYSGNFIGPHMHYADLTYCNNDVLFVAKQHRKSPLGLRLIRETEREAQRRGARMVLWHGKADTPLVNILPKMGYATQDIIYSRELAPSNFKFIERFDVAAALAETEIDDKRWLWDRFTARQSTAGSPHHDTRAIVLRGPDVDTIDHDAVFNKIESRDWTPCISTLPAITELCAAVCRRLRVAQLGRVMVVDLAPGGHIDRHHDDGAYAAHYSRFHLVLQSELGNTFTNGDETIHMQPGELWQFNHRAEHEVTNSSAAPRIHLIIDAVTE